MKIKDATEGTAALKSGKADAYAGDRLVLIEQVANSRDPSRFVMLNEMLSVCFRGHWYLKYKNDIP